MIKSTMFMMFDAHGNALGSFDDKEEAIISLDQIIQLNSEAKDEIVLFGYDKNGIINEVIRYEDTLSV